MRQIPADQVADRVGGPEVAAADPAGAPHASPKSLIPGLRALACSISHHSDAALQSMEPCVCSMLDSEPSVELMSPISTFRICSLAVRR